VGPLQARLDGVQAPGIEVAGDQDPLPPHHLADGQGLAAAASAIVDYRLAGLGAQQPGGDLAALVLHLELAGLEGVERGQLGGAGVQAQACR
jgi:hypothetical protein